MTGEIFRLHSEQIERRNRLLQALIDSIAEADDALILEGNLKAEGKNLADWAGWVIDAAKRLTVDT